MSSIQIHLQNNIADCTADCIVNAANAHLLPGSGVCGAIFEKAGYEDLQRACEMIGHCKVGSAVMTPAYKMNAKFIAHAVGPKWFGGEGGEPEQLYGAYKTSLELAKDHGCHSIVFPLISAGVYKYPVDKAWERAITACMDFLTNHPDYDLEISFSIRDEKIYETGIKELKKQEEAAAITAPPVSQPATPVRSDGFPELEQMINAWYETDRKEPPYEAINLIMQGLSAGVTMFVPTAQMDAQPVILSSAPKKDTIGVRMVSNPDGTTFLPAFTTMEEVQKGNAGTVTPYSLEALFNAALSDSTCLGLAINIWGNSYTLPSELLRRILIQLTPTEEEVEYEQACEAYEQGLFSKAFGLFTKAAVAGNTASMCHLGYMYYYGQGTEKNLKLAEKLLTKAVVLGQDISAMCLLGDLYREGPEMKDETYARQLYLHAFDVARNNPDLSTFPEICIRVLRYCSEVLTAELKAGIAQAAASVLKQRLEAGDPGAQALLTEVESYINA